MAPSFGFDWLAWRWWTFERIVPLVVSPFQAITYGLSLLYCLLS